MYSHPAQRSEHVLAFLVEIGTPGGSRTHTEQILSLCPLPIGIQEHVYPF